MNNSLQQRDRIEDKIIRRIDRCRQNQSDHVVSQDARRWYQTERTAQHTSRRRPLVTVGDMILHQAARSKNGSMLRMLGAGFAG